MREHCHFPKLNASFITERERVVKCHTFFLAIERISTKSQLVWNFKCKSVCPKLVPSGAIKCLCPFSRATIFRSRFDGPFANGGKPHHTLLGSILACHTTPQQLNATNYQRSPTRFRGMLCFWETFEFFSIHLTAARVFTKQVNCRVLTVLIRRIFSIREFCAWK